MKSGDVTVVLLVLGAVWVGMYNVINVVEIKNGKRDLVLKLSEQGAKLTVDQRRFILWHDYVTLEAGIICFLGLFSAAIASLPRVFKDKDSPMTKVERYCCYGAGAFGLLALLIEVVSAGDELRLMLNV
jgi:CDP-diglyceride synthetase